MVCPSPAGENFEDFTSKSIVFLHKSTISLTKILKWSTIILKFRLRRKLLIYLRNVLIYLRALEIESDVTGSMGAARGDAVAKFMSCREFMSAFTEWTIWILNHYETMLFDDDN